ncbi:MAG: AI-2E family transporter [Alistipes sp.]|nr:AI-2E family transporter [Alistipes sp.]
MTPQTITKYLVGIAVTAAIVFLVWYFSSIVIYILVAAALAVVGGPLVARLSRLHIRNRRVSRSAAAAITLLTMWAVFACLCIFVLPPVVEKLMQLSMLDFGAVLKRIEEPIVRGQELLSGFFGTSEPEFSLSDSLGTALRSVLNLKTVNSALSSIGEAVISIVIAFFSISFITFFFLREKSLFFDMVKALFPERYADNVGRALEEIKVLLVRYFTGILSESAILTVVITIVMMLFGMTAENALFTGLVMGIMNVIPYAGPLIGGIISVFAGIVNPIEGVTVGHTALIIAFSLLVIKGLDDFVLQPTLYSERVKAHPLEIFLVILIAGSLAGIVGMLLAIPLYTVIRVFAKEFFSQFKLVQKLTEKI